MNSAKSITIRVLLIIAVAIFTMAGIVSYQSIEGFKKEIAFHYKPLFIDMARGSGSQVFQYFNNLEKRIDVISEVYGSNLGSDELGVNKKLQSLLEKEGSNFSVHLLKTISKKKMLSLSYITPEKIDPNKLRGKKESNVARQIRLFTPVWLRNAAKSYKSEDIHVRSLTKKTKLPLLSIAKKIKMDQDQKGEYWAVLTIWQDKLLDIIGSESQPTLQKVVLDRSYQTLTSSDYDNMLINKRYDYLEIVKQSKGSYTRYSYLSNYRDRVDNQWFGAFYRINKFGLTFIIQKQLNVSMSKMLWIVKKNFLLGGIILLLSVFFGYLVLHGFKSNIEQVALVHEQLGSGNFDFSSSLLKYKELAALDESIILLGSNLQKLFDDKESSTLPLEASIEEEVLSTEIEEEVGAQISLENTNEKTFFVEGLNGGTSVQVDMSEFYTGEELLTIPKQDMSTPTAVKKEYVDIPVVKKG